MSVHDPRTSRARRARRAALGVALGIALAGTGLVSAISASATAPQADLTARPGIRHELNVQRTAVVDMRRVPRASAGATRLPLGEVPVGLGVPADVYAARKAAALRNRTSPAIASPLGPAPAASGGQSPSVARAPGLQASFAGQIDSAATCPFFGGCAPPDMAIAASPKFVLQGVNTSVAVYKPNGAIQAGFPKTFQSFFGIPTPTPAGCSGTRGPFTSDPRAFYDPNDKRFFFTALEVEGADSKNPTCTLASTYWMAVSKTSDPRGAWNVFSADMKLGTTNVADYTQIGFNTKGFYISANMFDKATLLTFQYAEICGLGKKAMENGQIPTSTCFSGLSAGVAVDTVQPLDSLSHDAGPVSEFFVNSFNIKSGGGQCVSGCSGLVLWAFSNVLKEQGSAAVLSGTVLSTNSYSLAPQADNPGTGGCTACIETIDTRITATPVYSHGEVWGALETKVNNGTQNVPGVFWFSLEPVLDHGTASCPLCAKVQSTSEMDNQGLYFYNGDGAAFFASLMPDTEGNIVMGFEFSGNTFDPSSVYTGRRTTEAPNAMEDGGTFLVASKKPTSNRRWGDYEASSWDGFTSDHNWVSLEHSCTTTGDWCTQIAKLGYGL